MAIDDLGAFADTVAGAAPDMTIRPPAGATAGMAMAATQADLGRTLPRLHVDEAGGAVAQGGDAPEAADLLVYGTLGEGGMGQVLLARLQLTSASSCVVIVPSGSLSSRPIHSSEY